MRAIAPDIVDSINTLRDQFPTLRVTSFVGGGLNYGLSTEEVGHSDPTRLWPVPEGIGEQKTTTVEEAEKKRKDIRARQRRKAKAK